MAKELTTEEKARRSERTKVCAAIAKKATEAGFKHEGGRGYWVALRLWCADNGVAYPMEKRGRKAGGAAPKAKAKKATTKRGAKKASR